VDTADAQIRHANAGGRIPWLELKLPDDVMDRFRC
jgi:hypothetical protein